MSDPGQRAIEALMDAISSEKNPCNDWVSVGRGFLQDAIKLIRDWRFIAETNAKQARAARATQRVAIEHLQAVLNCSRTHDEQQQADRRARDWLESIGSE